MVREELVRVSKEMCSKGDQSRLGLALRGVLPILDHEFILHWVPEQAEDIYWVLISPTEIAEVELIRNRASEEESVSLKVTDVAMFLRRHLPREVKERLEIALELTCT
uniref:Uncharacterized protein n=1 Tax=Ralstonia solanacearum TaxID=305 RepID=A0A0S4V5D3_RALSL|nr:conserved protein of unknown function [Ralstonia solanacearum]